MNDMTRLRWQLRAKTREYLRHVAYAVAAIHAAQRSARMVISWSAGKDSTAMVHLIRSLYPDTPIMIQFDDCDWPSKRPYAERVCAAHGWSVHVVEPDFSVWDRMRVRRIGEDEFCALSDRLTQDSFLKPLAQRQAELGSDGIYMGLRAGESRARRLHLSRRGELYRIKNGEWRCCPLARWTSEDVFAYLLEHGVEINPCYFQNRFLPPEEIRISWAVPTPQSMRRGAIEHLRSYYPSQFNRLRELGVR